MVIHQKECKMTETKRFIVNQDDRVIDTFHPSSRPTGSVYEWDSQDDTHLREIVLSARLSGLISDFVFDPPLPRHWADYTDHQRNLTVARNSMLLTLVAVIRASKLNGSEVDASKRESGTPKQKTGLLHQTSISLFLDDVECLLSDLYGNIDTVAYDDTMSAVGMIVEEFTGYTRPDVYQEQLDARDWDTCMGIGNEGYGISGSDYRRGHEGLDRILKRSRAVLQDQASFNPYTVRFATYCVQNYRDRDGTKQAR